MTGAETWSRGLHLTARQKEGQPISSSSSFYTLRPRATELRRRYFRSANAERDRVHRNFQPIPTAHEGCEVKIMLV